MVFIRRGMCYTKCRGGDLASTWVAKPEVHAEKEISRKSDSLNINANAENFAGDEAISGGAVAA